MMQWLEMSLKYAKVLPDKWLYAPEPHFLEEKVFILIQ